MLLRRWRRGVLPLRRHMRGLLGLLGRLQLGGILFVLLFKSLFRRQWGLRIWRRIVLPLLK